MTLVFLTFEILRHFIQKSKPIRPLIVKEPLSNVDLLNILAGGISLFLMSAFIAWSAQYTIMTHVAIFGGLPGIILILARLISC